MTTKRQVVAKCVILEGKKSEMKMGDGMEFMTIFIKECANNPETKLWFDRSVSRELTVQTNKLTKKARKKK